jgi:hypothetical protein
VPAAAAPPTPPTLADCDPSKDLVTIFTKADATKVCCPKSGFECIGDNKATYCENGAPKVAAIDAECPSRVAAKCTGYTAAANEYLVQSPIMKADGTTPEECVSCPPIGFECDNTKFTYTNDKNAYCTRVAGTVANSYSYTLDIMKIPKWCPQRQNGFSLIVPTIFAVNSDSKIVCPLADAKMLGLHYSTFADPNYTVETTRIA